MSGSVSSDEGSMSSSYSTESSQEYSNTRLEKYKSINTEVVVTTADEEAMAGDIYKHLRESEANRRPSTDFMEKIQKGSIDSSMRATLIDWLVVVAEDFKLVPDTLFLAANYIDRYLSGNVMDLKQLQLLGATCLMVAAKYDNNESNEAAQKWCDITDNTYVETDVLQMELAVLRYLKYEMTAPTAVCFLRRFCFVAQQHSGKDVFAPSEVNFWWLALYIAELSLVEYKMLCYAPSLIAASSVFLAKFLHSPSTRPWNSTLRHCTLYQASDLCDCVEELRDLICCDAYNSRLTAVRDKYCQPEYQFVATKYCSPPDSIPPAFFHDISN